MSSLDNLLDEFVRAGILLRSAEPEGIALAQPPEAVAVKDILDIVSDSATSIIENIGPAAHVLLRRDEAVEKMLEGTNLRFLAMQIPLDDVKRPRSGTG